MNFSFLIEMWDGFFFVLLSFIVQAFFIFLGNMGRGLMKGGLKIATKTWLWVIVIIFYLFQNLVGFPLLFNGRWIPFLLLVAIQVGGIIMLFNAKKTNKVADAINEHRIVSHDISKELFSIIQNENAARISVLEDGIVIQNSNSGFNFDKATIDYKLVSPNGITKETAWGTSHRIPHDILSNPSVTRIIQFMQYGYQDMDDNTKRGFASALSKYLGNYVIQEAPHTHQERRIYVSSDGPATAYHNAGTNSYTIVGGGGSDYEEKMITVTDGYSYFLIRRDLLPQQMLPVQVNEKKPKLKKW